MLRTISLALTVIVLFAASRPATAVTFGQLDADNLFPNVGAVVVVQPRLDLPNQQVPFSIVSGTLIHPRILLTAGHGTAGIEGTIAAGRRTMDHFRVSFAPNAFDDSSWLEVESVFTHPSFRTTSAGGGINMVDIGVVVLKEPVDLPIARLPHERFLDELKADGKLRVEGVSQQFLLAGYGRSLDFPPPETIPADGLRRYVYSDFQALLPDWLLLNQVGPTGNGGSGFGDSGGPRFWIEPDGSMVLSALVTRGDPKLVATEFAARLDKKDALNFIQSVIALVDSPAGGVASLMTASTVPEPGSLILLTAGLLPFVFGASARCRSFGSEYRRFH